MTSRNSETDRLFLIPMSFSEKYQKQFYHVADQIVEKYVVQGDNTLCLGNLIDDRLPPEVYIDIMDVWVTGIEKLLCLSHSMKDGEKMYTQLYTQRGITYMEYYYLFSKHLSEEQWSDYPAYLFTKTYTEDHRSMRFNHLTYCPKDYVTFICSFDLLPTKYFKAKSKAYVSISNLESHSYCVAKTRSGKTELLKVIVHNLVQRKNRKTSLLILDPHGEMAREIRRFSIVKNNLDEFVYLDPTLDRNFTPVFNPFDVQQKSDTELAYATDVILDAFEQLLRNQSITGNMKRLLRHCIYAMLHGEQTDMMDLLTLLSAINRNRNKNAPEFSSEENHLMQIGRHCPDPITKRFFEYGWKEVDGRTISAVVERIDGILSHPLVRRFVTGKNSFDLEKYLNNGKTVIVNLDFTRLGNIGSEAIGRLIVSHAQNISSQRNRLAKHERPKTMIFMDECQRFVSAAIERALSEFGKFNTYLFLSHQYIEQIDDGMVKAMLSNSENKIVGRNSAASMSSISTDIGVTQEELMQIKKYQFYIKIGDTPAFLFQSSDELLETPESKYYLSEKEAEELIDTYMIKKYYRAVGNQKHNNNYLQKINPQDNNLSTHTSQKFKVDIKENDF